MDIEYGEFVLISRRHRRRSTSLKVLLLCIIIMFVYVLLLLMYPNIFHVNQIETIVVASYYYQCNALLHYF